jgi:hypothetical protein
LLSWKHYDKLQHMLGGVNGGVMEFYKKQELIARAQVRYCLLFFEVAECGDCLIVSDSGHKARYMIGYTDQGELFKERLDLKTCPV